MAFPQFLDELMAGRGWRPSGRPPRHRISHWRPFPYPKLKGRPRDPGDLHRSDRLVAHAVVARVAEQIDKSLGRRMSANRLARSGPNWALVHFRKARGTYRDDRLRSLADHLWQYTLITDVSSYYPSISRDLLIPVLRGIQCDGAVDTIEELLTTWQTRDGLRGLPMGQQAFGVLAAPMMGPADAMMEKCAMLIAGTSAAWKRGAPDLIGNSQERPGSNLQNYASQQNTHDAGASTTGCLRAVPQANFLKALCHALAGALSRQDHS